MTNATLSPEAFSKITSDKNAADLDAVREIQLWIDNTEPLYRQYQSIEANYLRKMAKNQYDPALARKGWLNLVDRAWRDYRSHFGSFPMSPASRRYAAHLIARDWEEEHGDEYNAMHDRIAEAEAN